ncbi:AAA family ATPase [Streptomyces sp. NPDC048324]|uniref:AAA family ATPase n=1 Tax=Streptomyces sp. NPDC048324 TaxID=3157205 RepID=UPI00341AABC7
MLEGLSAVGKSTVAPFLARSLDAAALPTLLPQFEHVRKGVDETRLVMPRLHFWMMTNYAVSETIRRALRQGQNVVIESYFYRTLATHSALGVTQLPEVDWNRALVPDMAFLLTVDESVRKRRMAERERRDGLSYWSRMEESNVTATRRMYESFGLTHFDTNGLDVASVVEGLTQVVNAQWRQPLSRSHETGESSASPTSTRCE